MDQGYSTRIDEDYLLPSSIPTTPPVSVSIMDPDDWRSRDVRLELKLRLGEFVDEPSLFCEFGYDTSSWFAWRPTISAAREQRLKRRVRQVDKSFRASLLNLDMVLRSRLYGKEREVLAHAPDADPMAVLHEAGWHVARGSRHRSEYAYGCAVASRWSIPRGPPCLLDLTDDLLRHAIRFPAGSPVYLRYSSASDF